MFQLSCDWSAGIVRNKIVHLVTLLSFLYLVCPCCPIVSLALVEFVGFL